MFKKGKIKKGNLYLTKNPWSRNEMWFLVLGSDNLRNTPKGSFNWRCAVDNHNYVQKAF